MNTALSGISRAGGAKRAGERPGLSAGLRRAWQEALWRRMQRYDLTAMVAHEPAAVQFAHEVLGAAVDARAHADLLQEGHEPVVLAAMVVRQNFTDVARVREALALGHPQE